MADASSGAGEPEEATDVFNHLKDHDVDEGLV